jgi:hypothetical protein
MRGMFSIGEKISSKDHIMARQSLKSISPKAEKFIPKKYKDDPMLSEGAAEVADRPLIFEWKKLSREDKLNIQSMGGFQTDQTDEGPAVTLTRMGDVAKYIWNNAVTRLFNVILDDKPLDVISGPDKDKLWYSEGMEEEIIEVVLHIQKESYLTEVEVKN